MTKISVDLYKLSQEKLSFLHNGEKYVIYLIFFFLGGGGGREGYSLDFEISLFCDTFYFNKLQPRNPKREGGKSIHFLKTHLKTSSEIDVSRSWIWRYVK